MHYLLIAISIFVPPLWFITVPYIFYLIITRRKRGDEYATEGLIWETGGVMGTGDKDIGRAISLYRKSCSMGSARGCFFLAQSYKSGHGAPESKIDYNKYIEKSKELDPEVYRRLQGDIEQILSSYEKMPPLGSTQYKMKIRIMHMNIQGGNKSELKSKLKEAIAKPEFKEAIENDIFKWLTFIDYDDYMVRDNVSLVQASADRMISSLNDKVDGCTDTY